MGERAGDGDFTEPFVCDGSVPLDADCDGEWPLMELDSAAFLGVEPLEMLAYPFDVICIPLLSGRILFSTKRFVGGLAPGLSTVESLELNPAVPVSYGSAANKWPTTPWDLSGDTGDDRRRRRELRVTEIWSMGTRSERAARSDENTAEIIEDVGFGKCWSVLVD